MLTLTPQARAIAAFTVSVLLVLGHLNKIGLAVVLVFGDSYPSGRGGAFLTSVILIAIAAAVVLFAMSAVGAVASDVGWEANLARAAVAVAALGLLIAVLLGIGAVANTGGFPSNGYYNPGLFF
ncbi:MAG: hypothetical protein ACJ72O_08765 [Marmoricola sp.]